MIHLEKQVQMKQFWQTNQLIMPGLLYMSFIIIFIIIYPLTALTMIRSEEWAR